MGGGSRFRDKAQFREFAGVAITCLVITGRVAFADSNSTSSLQQFVLSDTDIVARCQQSSSPPQCISTYQAIRNKVQNFLNAEANGEQNINDSKNNNSSSSQIANLNQQVNTYLASLAFDSAGNTSAANAQQNANTSSSTTSTPASSSSGGNQGDASQASNTTPTSGTTQSSDSQNASTSSSNLGTGNQSNNTVSSDPSGNGSTSSNSGSADQSNSNSASNSQNSNSASSASGSSNPSQAQATNTSPGQGSNGNSGSNNVAQSQSNSTSTTTSAGPFAATPPTVSSLGGFSDQFTSDYQNAMNSVGGMYSNLASNAASAVAIAVPNTAAGASPSKTAAAVAAAAAASSSATSSATSTSNASNLMALTTGATSHSASGPAYMGSFGRLSPDSLPDDSSSAAVIKTPTSNGRTPASNIESDSVELWNYAMSNGQARADFVGKLATDLKFRQAVARDVQKAVASKDVDMQTVEFVRMALMQAQSEAISQSELKGLKPETGKDNPFSMDVDGTRNEIAHLLAKNGDDEQNAYLASPSEPLFSRVHMKISHMLKDGHVKRPSI